MQTTIKQEAYSILERLPDTATWDDVMYEMYLQQAIDKGIEAGKQDKVLGIDEVRKIFGISK